MSKPYEVENRAVYHLVGSTTVHNNVLEKLDYLGVHERERVYYYFFFNRNETNLLTVLGSTAAHIPVKTSQKNIYNLYANKIYSWLQTHYTVFHATYGNLQVQATK